MTTAFASFHSTDTLAIWVLLTVRRMSSMSWSSLRLLTFGSTSAMACIRLRLTASASWLLIVLRMVASNSACCSGGMFGSATKENSVLVTSDL